MSAEPRIYVPRPHQKLAAEFLLDTPRAMLAADMGLGKTATVLSVLDALKLAGSSFFPALVIAPLRVADVVWQNEVAKWASFRDLRVTKIIGTPLQRRNALRSPQADIYTVNYENIEWLITTLGDCWPFKIVVADESTRLKGFRLVRGGHRATALSKIAKHTGRWINLTGTPAPNGLQDLWGQFWFVDGGERLGRTYTAFTTRFFWENQYTKELKPVEGAQEKIYTALSDVMLTLRAEDWLDIRKPVRTSVEVALPSEARRIYDQMEKDFFTQFGDHEIEAFNAAAKSLKLLQIASGSIYDTEHHARPVHDAKNEALHSVVNEVQEPLLVVYHWQFDPPRILKAFPKARIYQTEKDRRDWNAGKIPMLLIHPKSAGHGVDLQDGGRAIVFYSRSWDLELEMQVIERLGPARQFQAGHDRSVLIYDLIATDTMDQVALDRVDSKRSVQDALMLARRQRLTHGATHDQS